MNVILIAVIILGVVGLVASIMLYAASKKFAVVEDERIGQVAEVLPQANCGGIAVIRDVPVLPLLA